MTPQWLRLLAFFPPSMLCNVGRSAPSPRPLCIGIFRDWPDRALGFRSPSIRAHPLFTTAVDVSATARHSQGSLVSFRVLEDSGAEGRDLGITGNLHDTRA